MNLQPILENETIHLRPLKEDDFEPLYQIAKDPLIWEQHPCADRYKKEVYAEFFKESLDSQGALIVIDKSQNIIIGSSRYKPIPQVDSAVEIGWSFLSRDYWGGRYNKMMKKLMIDHAFDYVEDIIFYVNDTNIRSQKAVLKIGGERITDTKYKHLLNKNSDIWTYRINKLSFHLDSK